MPQELLVDVSAFETRVALFEDGELLELHLERSDAQSLIGNIYLGTVCRVAANVQAAFVDIGLPRPGFLPERSGESDAAPWVQGQRVLVEVVKDPLNGKGLRLSANVSVTGRNLVLTPFDAALTVSRRIEDETERARLEALAASARNALGSPCGCIVRTAAQGAEGSRLRDELERLLGVWRRIGERCEQAPLAPTLVHEELPLCLRMARDLASLDATAIVVNDPATHAQLSALATDFPAPPRVHFYEGALGMFESHGVEAAIRNALQPNVPLPGGGNLLIEHTRAMTTIDVNSGSATNTRNLAATAFDTNLQAARVIPRELRRRNIGGIIVVDFIDMHDPGHQRAVSAALEAAALGDSAWFSASGFSRLGLVEISRRRTRDSLAAQLGERCPTCQGDRTVLSAQSACYDVLRAVRQRVAAGGAYLLQAAPPVVDRLLEEDAAHFAAIRHQFACEIRVRKEPLCPLDRFQLTPLAQGERANPFRAVERVGANSR